MVGGDKSVIDFAFVQIRGFAKRSPFLMLTIALPYSASVFTGGFHTWSKEFAAVAAQHECEKRRCCFGCNVADILAPGELCCTSRLDGVKMGFVALLV
jgi:hypothetical protein